MKKNINIKLNEGLWVAVGQIAAILGSFAGVKIFTNIMNPEEYGELTVCLTLVALINQTIFSPLASALTRYWIIAVNQYNAEKLLVLIWRVVILVGVGIFIIGMLALTTLRLIGENSWIVPIEFALILGVLAGVNSLYAASQNAARHRKIVALHQGVEPWLRYFFAFILISILGSDSGNALIGFSIGAMLLIISNAKAFEYKFYSVSYSKSDWERKIWNYTWPLSIAGVTSWGFMASQTWALQLFSGSNEVGYYSALVQLGFTPMTIIGGFLTTLLMPVIFEKAGNATDQEKMYEIYRVVVKYAICGVLFIFVVALFAYIFHSKIFLILTSKTYEKYSYLLPLSIAAGGLLQVSIFLATIPLAFINTSVFIPLNIYGNIIISINNALFAFAWGLDGLFVGMLISSLFHVIWNIFNIRKFKRKI